MRWIFSFLVLMMAGAVARGESSEQLLQQALAAVDEGRVTEGRELLVAISADGDPSIGSRAYDRLAQIDYDRRWYRLAAKEWHRAADLAHDNPSLGFQARYREAVALSDDGRMKDAREALSRITPQMLLAQDGTNREKYAQLDAALTRGGQTAPPMRLDTAVAEKSYIVGAGFAYGGLSYSENGAAGQRFSSAALLLEAQTGLGPSWSGSIATTIPFANFSKSRASSLEYLSAEAAIVHRLDERFALRGAFQFTSLLGSAAAGTGFGSAFGPYLQLEVRQSVSPSVHLEGAASAGTVADSPGSLFDLSNRRLSAKFGVYRVLGSLELGLGASYTALAFTEGSRRHDARYVSVFAGARL